VTGEAPLLNPEKRQHLDDAHGARSRESSQPRRRPHLPATVCHRRRDQYRRQWERLRRRQQRLWQRGIQRPARPCQWLHRGWMETNDPLTNLNSGLSTNLVLGLNSISEVTVNTLSYSVDQGRYGASQVNYVTKSGTNQFSRESLRAVEWLGPERRGLLHQRDARQSQSRAQP